MGAPGALLRVTGIMGGAHRFSTVSVMVNREALFAERSSALRIKRVLVSTGMSVISQAPVAIFIGRRALGAGREAVMSSLPAVMCPFPFCGATFQLLDFDCGVVVVRVAVPCVAMQRF